MKRAIARSRCEVGGEVYLPGDDMTITDEQFATLQQFDAVTEIRVFSPPVAPPSEVDVTIEAVHGAYARKIKAQKDKGKQR